MININRSKKFRSPGRQFDMPGHSLAKIKGISESGRMGVRVCLIIETSYFVHQIESILNNV